MNLNPSTPNINYIKKTYPVLNMSCASCAINAENTVKHIEGVAEASVNFATTNLTVVFQPEVITPTQIQKAVQDAGYDLLIEEETSQQDAFNAIQLKHFKKLKIKTILALLFSLPLMIISMFFMQMPFANEIQWLLSTPVVAWLGKDFFINAWKQAKHRTSNMDTLVALSTGIAYLFSVFNLLFPKYWTQKGIEAHVYFEAASVIIAFILLGKLLEEKAKGNTSTAIKKLMGLQPKSVTLITKDGSEIITSADNINLNDLLLIKPGEKIAVDGVVQSGNSYVDESMLNGEPVPVFKSQNDTVFAGTINQKGSFKYVATKVGKDTLLAQIIRMVQDAQGSKAPVQKLADKIAGIFVPIVLGISVLTFISWNIFGGNNGLTQGLMAAITVLIIACPCALGLATPTAIMVGIGKGAEQGILIKDAESLELAKKINTVVLDKTGTITEGKPQVNHIKWLLNDDTEKTILYSIEKQSEHPLATAITDLFPNTTTVHLTHFESITGKGIKATYNNVQYWVGNKKLMEENNLLIDDTLQQLTENWENNANTIIWFAKDDKALAAIAITDTIKETSAVAIQQLHHQNIEVYMLTGDNEKTAMAIAKQVGIKHIQASMLPQQKAAFIKTLQQQNKIVAMVGDGINDSAALATANVSIAMGKGSDIAMDTAMMTIVSSNLTKIPIAIKLSKQTVSVIKQNLFWAFIYNIIGIPIAAGILFPINGFLLNPMLAGAAMALSSVSVVSNSLTLKWRK